MMVDAHGDRRNPRRILQAALECIDGNYRRRRGLVPVGPLLFVGKEPWRGAALPLHDGTRLEVGAWIGHLHFNNSRAAAVRADGRSQAGIRFARLLRTSFAELAERACNDDHMRDIALYEGVTWLRAHGNAVGFHAQPLPAGVRRWLLGVHFRLLIWAFAPAAREAAMAEVLPRRFRITRQALIDGFGRRRSATSVAVRSANARAP